MALTPSQRAQLLEGVSLFSATGASGYAAIGEHALAPSSGPAVGSALPAR